MIYRIKSDETTYLMLTYSKKYKLAAMKEIRSGNKKTLIGNASPLVFSDDWEEIEVLFIDGYPEKKTQKVLPDIAYTTGRLFLSEKAAITLDGFLSDGELLAVRYDDNKKGFIFNPLKIVKANSKLSTRNEHGDITSIVFDEENRLFKTEFNHYRAVFCNDEFKNAVEKHKLTGVIFDVDLSHPYVDDGSSEVPISH